MFKTIHHDVDFCVVGGGLSGLCAAVAAARNGIKVALVQDRPMLGGNASSEVRMWVCGARGDNNRETGIVEEILLENYYRNPCKNYSIWDSILYEKARLEPNITLLLNCSAQDGVMNGDSLQSVKCWQLTTQLYHEITAKIFADCSGDSILAPITDAPYRMGREARDEFDEDIAPAVADDKTMGMSCLIQSRETASEKKYIPPTWAEKYTKSDLPYRTPNITKGGENFWYLELGGMQNTIEQTEEIRDELQRVAYGIWDYVKNSDDTKDMTKNYDLEWIGMLPGKRESRRYIGDYIMTQNDVRNEGRFEDIVAYGGWSMDDHHPGGFRTSEKPTIYHPAPSPYGIPYRAMYSKTVSNLMFAGRNISVTHSAMSSTRVMATCGVIGQAVGTAAAIAVLNNLTPRGVYENKLHELKQTLMYDDCYLPFNKRDISETAKNATLTVSCNTDQAENLRNGIDRIIGEHDNGWYGQKDGWAKYNLKAAEHVEAVRLIFDSDLNRATLPEKESKLNRPMFSNYHLDDEASYVPKTVIRDFEILYTTESGERKKITVTGNYQRMCILPIGETVSEITFVPKSTHGSELYHLFAFDF